MKLELGLKEFIAQTVIERWHEENNKFLMSQGFKRDVLKHPETIPPTQAGDYPGSSLDYDPKFPSEIIDSVYNSAKSKEDAKAIIDAIFLKIKRGVYPDLVADGDHHSITYGESIFPRYYRLLG